MRKIREPPDARVCIQAMRKAKALPRWMRPVGLGASRPRWEEKEVYDM